MDENLIRLAVIARRMNVSSSSVLHWARKLGLPLETNEFGWKYLSAADAERLIAAFRERKAK
jgi:hypothetical protein